MKTEFRVFFFALCIWAIPGFGQTYILNEDFSSASGTNPPTGWSNINIVGQSYDKWHFDNPGSRNLNFPVAGQFAIFDSQNYSQNGGPEEAVLQSPILDCSIGMNILLFFDHQFVGGNGGQGFVEVYNGLIWSTVATYSLTSANPSHVVLNISAPLGGISNAKIRFRWVGNASMYWAIDNIKVLAPLYLDAGVTQFNGPQMPFPSGTYPVSVSLANFGFSTLTSASIAWTVNDVAQTPVAWTGSIPYGQSVSAINLGNVSFPSGLPVTIRVWPSDPNNSSDLNAWNDTLVETFYSCLEGVYTIGGINPSYVSLSQAAEALNLAGLCDSVRFRIRNGTYNERIRLGTILGNSAINTITFESESADSSAVLLHYQMTDPYNDYSVMIDGADYVTFKGLSIFRSNGSYALVIQGNSHHVQMAHNQIHHVLSPNTSCDSVISFNNSNFLGYVIRLFQSNSLQNQHVSISNCIGIGGIESNTLNGLTLQNDQIGWVNLQNLKNVEILNSTIYTGGTALTLVGCDNVLVQNNDIDFSCWNWGTHGLYIENGGNLRIRNNSIDRICAWGWGDGWAIYTYNNNNILIQDNDISNWHGIHIHTNDTAIVKGNYLENPYGYGHGIYFGTSLDSLQISNNFVTGFENGIYGDAGVLGENWISGNEIWNIRTVAINVNGSFVHLLNNQIENVFSGSGIQCNGNLFEIKGNSLKTCYPGNGISCNGNNYLVSYNRIGDIRYGDGIFVNGIGSTLFNNYVQVGGEGTANGFHLGSGSENTRVLFNSFKVTSNDVENGNGLLVDGGTGLAITNNIFSNHGGGYAARFNSNPVNSLFNRNNYFAQGFKLIFEGGNEWPSVNAWSGSSGLDAQSLSENPFFSNDSALIPNQVLLNNAALPDTAVVLDIDSIGRGVAPDVGAIEFAPCSVDAGVNHILGLSNPLPVDSIAIYAVLQNQGTSALSGATLHWSVNGNPMATVPWVGNLPMYGSDTVLLGTFAFDPGTSYNVSAWTSQPNGLTDCNPANDLSFLDHLITPLCGTYTIGGGNPDFQNFTEAVNALNMAGISCPVTFLVRDGFYNERIKINPINGSSPVNTITFQGESSDSTTVDLNYQVYNPTNNYTLMFNGTRYITFRKMGIHRSNGVNPVLITGGSHNITIENCQLSFVNSPSSSLDSVILIQHNYISGQINLQACRNVVIHANTIPSNETAIYFSGNSSAVISDNDIQYGNCCGHGIQIENSGHFLVQNNHVQKASYCWWCDGWSFYSYNVDYVMVSGNHLIGTHGLHIHTNDTSVVVGNLIENPNHNGHGIYLANNLDSLRIDSNEIRFAEYGIYADASFNAPHWIRYNVIVHPNTFGIRFEGSNTRLIGNTIQDVQLNSAMELIGNQYFISENVISRVLSGRGINCTNGTDYEICSNQIRGVGNYAGIRLNSAKNLVCNNFIQTTDFGISSGILVEVPADSTKILFNNILAKATYDYQVTGVEFRNGNGLEFRNNCIEVPGGGYCVALYAPAAGINFGNNNYFSPSQKIGRFNGTVYSTVSGWQTAIGSDAGTLSENPFYLNDSILIISQSLLNNAGSPSPFVTVDRDLVQRSSTQPDIGANEWNLCSVDAGINAVPGLQNPMVTGVQSINVQVRNHGASPISLVQINWSVNGVSQPPYFWNGSLLPGASQNIFAGSFNFLPGQLYQIKAWTAQPNGNADCNLFNDTLNLFDLFTPLCGIYTVGGTNPDFSDLTSAARALNLGGVICPVIFKLRDGTYNESISINQFAGGSAINTVTFESENNDSSLVTLNFSGYAPSNDHTLLLNGSDFMSFRKMGIVRTNGDTSLVIRNNAHHNSFLSNRLGNVFSPAFSCDSVLTFSKNRMDGQWIKLLQPPGNLARQIVIEKSWMQKLEIDNSDDIQISKNYLLYNPYQGYWNDRIVLKICNSQHLVISENEIHQENYNTALGIGIDLDHCNRNQISENSIYGNSYYGNYSIRMVSCQKTRVELNDLYPVSYNIPRFGLYDYQSDSLLSRANQYNGSDLNSDGYGAYLDGTTTLVKFDHDSIVNFRTGIYMNSAATSNYVLANKFHHNRDNGIYLNATNGPTLIDQNVITNQTSGIGINLNNPGTVVSNNRLVDFYEGQGIRINGPNSFVYNNFIHCGGYGMAKGVVTESAGANSSIVFNSINISSTHDTLGRAFEMQGGSGLKVKNNIFSNPGGGFAAWISPSTTGYNWDYNNYYTSGAFLAKYQGLNKVDLVALQQATGNDPNSKSLNPFFQSATELRPWQREINGAGVPVSNVLLDIDGEIRNANAPDMGADEFTVDFGVIELITPTLDCNLASNDSVRVLLKQYGDIPFIGLQVAYRVNNGPVHVELVPGAIDNDIVYTFDATESFLAAGTYHFKIWLVNANDDNINNDTLEVDRYNSASPHIDLGWQTQCAGVDVPFWASGSISNGSISQYVWDFGDGNSGIGQNITHNYGVSGNYSVTLFVYSAIGCYADTVVNVSLMPTPIAGFSAPAVCLGSPTEFQNTSQVGGNVPMAFNWNFGSGPASTLVNPSYGFAVADTFDVQLVASTGQGCADTLVQAVVVFPVPNAQLIGLPTALCTNGSDIVLNGTPAGGVFAGNGVLYNVIKPSLLQPGTFPVTYTIGNQFGCVDADTVVVTIYQSPSVDFSGLPANTCHNSAPIPLTGSPAGGTYSGPGVAGNTFNPVSLSLGLQSVVYTYTDIHGCSNLSFHNTTIIPNPVASFSGLSAHYCVTSAQISLSGNPAGGTFSGSGVSGNQFSPQSVPPGIYSVDYLYQAANGCSDTAHVLTEVHALPTLGIIGLNPHLCVNSANVALTGSPAGGSFSGIGVSANVFHPNQLEIGTYTVTYSYTSVYGCSNSTFSTTIIHDLPTPNLGADIILPQNQSMTVTPGSYPAYLWSNLATSSVLTILYPGTWSVTVTDEFGCKNSDAIQILAPPWSYVNTGLAHTIAIPVNASLIINGQPVEVGDLIGVFYDSLGTLKNAGYLLWNNQTSLLTVYGDNLSTPAKEGFSPNEVFKWRVYDFSATQQYTGYPTYSTAYPNTNQFVNGGSSGLTDLAAYSIQTQTIPLPQNWSIYSTYLTPVNPNMVAVISGIVQNVAIVKNGSGQVYWPSININSIGNLVTTQGYQIKCFVPCTLSVTGVAVVPDVTPINLPLNWSIMAYLRQVPGNTVAMLSSIVSNIHIVKNGNGLVYWPSLNLNSIGNMVPGQGYQIKIKIAPVVLYYPSNPGIGLKYGQEPPKPVHFCHDLQTGNNMTLGILAQGFNSELTTGRELPEFGVFDSRGVLVGSGTLTGDWSALAVWGDDDLSPEKEGLAEGEPFTLRLWEPGIGTRNLFEPGAIHANPVQDVELTWIEGEGLYQKDGIARVVILERRVGIGRIQLLPNVPNPFGSETGIRFTVQEKSHIGLEVYDLLGTRVGTLTFGDYEPGLHTEMWDSGALPAGQYVVRLTSGPLTLWQILTKSGR